MREKHEYEIMNTTTERINLPFFRLSKKIVWALEG